MDIFSQDFYNRDSFDEMIKMRGNNPMLTSELHILLNISAPWMLTSVYDAHNNKNNNNDKRVIGIAHAKNEKLK